MIDEVVRKLVQRIGWACYQFKHDQITATEFLIESRLALAAVEDFYKISPEPKPKE